MATDSQNYSVNAGGYQILGMRLVETAPPNSPFASMMGLPGTQTTPSLARGNLNGSAIALMNNNLEHACDFKFMFTIDFSTFGLVNPVEAIQKALQNAKLKATNRLRSILKDAMKAFRLAIDSVLSVLGMDPSGQLSLSFQIGKDLLRTVNKAIQDVAEKVEEIMEWVYFAQQIEQLVNYIKSLPAKLQAMLSACLTNFNNSIKQVVNTFESIPSQILNATQGQIQTIASQFTQATQEIANAAQNSLDSSTSGMPEALYQALMDPSSSTASAVQTHIDNSSGAEDAAQQANNTSSAVNAKF